MITIKTYEAERIVMAADAIVNQRISARLAYDITKIMMALEDEAAAYGKARMAVVDKYATMGEDSKPIIKDGHYMISDEAAFNAELEPVGMAEIVIDKEPISISALEADGVKVTPLDMKSLAKVLKD